MGFQAEHRSVFAISLLKDFNQSPWHIGGTDAPFPLVNAASQVRQRLAPLAGIRSVAFSLRGNRSTYRTCRSISNLLTAPPRSVAFNAVSQNYFDSLGMRFVAGHSFSSDSLIGVPAEVVANHSLVKLLWPADSALGKTVKVGHFRPPALLQACGLSESLTMLATTRINQKFAPAGCLFALPRNSLVWSFALVRNELTATCQCRHWRN